MIQIHHKEDASSGAFPNLAIGQTTKIWNRRTKRMKIKVVECRSDTIGKRHYESTRASHAVSSCWRQRDLRRIFRLFRL